MDSVFLDVFDRAAFQLEEDPPFKTEDLILLVSDGKLLVEIPKGWEFDGTKCDEGLILGFNSALKYFEYGRADGIGVVQTQCKKAHLAIREALGKLRRALDNNNSIQFSSIGQRDKVRKAVKETLEKTSRSH